MLPVRTPALGRNKSYQASLRDSLLLLVVVVVVLLFCCCCFVMLFCFYCVFCWVVLFLFFVVFFVVMLCYYCFVVILFLLFCFCVFVLLVFLFLFCSLLFCRVIVLLCFLLLFFVLFCSLLFCFCCVLCCFVVVFLCCLLLFCCIVLSVFCCCYAERSIKRWEAFEHFCSLNHWGKADAATFLRQLHCVVWNRYVWYSTVQYSTCGLVSGFLHICDSVGLYYMWHGWSSVSVLAQSREVSISLSVFYDIPGAVECGINVSTQCSVHVFQFTGWVTTCIYNEYHLKGRYIYFEILLLLRFYVP